MSKRSHNEITDEAIEILSNGEYTITQFMSKLNVNLPHARKILDILSQRGLIQTVTKRSKPGNMVCIHYHLTTKGD